MRFPKISDVAAELREINKYELQPEDADEGIDVRLQVYPDGQWAVHSGSSDYDQDHGGYWGASSVPGNNRRFNSKDVARELIDQAKNAEAEGAGFEEAPVQEASQPNLPGIPAKLEIRLPNMPWEQIGGDMDPATYGGLIARSDNDADGNPIALELVEIQPVREYVGDAEAAEVGFPFWSKEAWYDLNDLDPDRDEVKSALQSIGMTIEELGEEAEGRKAAGERGYTPEQRALVIAEALMGYGSGVDEGPAGWSSDIYPDEEVKWWGGGVQTIESVLAEEDDEFKREVLGEEDDEEVEEAAHPREAPRGRREAADPIAARELELYIDNTSDLSLLGPSGQGHDIVKNLTRKIRSGKYDFERSIDLMQYLVESGAKRYAKEFGGDWRTMFTPATRDIVARSLAESFRERHESGDLGEARRTPHVAEPGDTPTAQNILEWLGPYMEHAGLDAPRESARLARLIANARTNRQAEEALEEVNRVIGGHGIEPIQIEGAYIDGYYFDIVATYVNMGDTYNPTLLHESETGRFVLTSWGDWFEANEAEYLPQEEEEEPDDDDDLDEARRRPRAAQSDPWKGQPRRPALPDQRLIDQMASKVADIRSKRRITFEQAYDAINPKPDWLRRYWMGGGDKLYSENLIINRAKQLSRKGR